ncbi:MAG TPA: hypothetical protein VMH86_11935 [Rhizomicrobium sp.]|nr:hypothetical protein [Rhizomicrobium sp.]
MNRTHIAIAAMLAGALTAAPALAQTGTTPSSQGNPMQSSMSSKTGSAVSLSAVSNPATTIANAAVDDSTGQQVGQVQKVKTNSKGKPTAVEVSLTSGAKTVSIRASKLKFDQSSNLLKADMSYSQIQALPAVQNP